MLYTQIEGTVIWPTGAVECR